MSNTLTTGKISYVESGITTNTYNIVVTQVESTRSGYVRFALRNINCTNDTGQDPWSNYNGRAFYVTTQKSMSASYRVAESESVSKYNGTGYVEFAQSYLNQTLYFSYGWIQYGSLSSAKMLDAFDLSYTLEFDLDEGTDSVSVTRDSSNVSDLNYLIDNIVYAQDVLTYHATLKSGMINTADTPIIDTVTVGEGYTVTIRTIPAESYTLIISQQPGVNSILVIRTASIAGMPLGEIVNGDTVKPQDKLSITVEPKAGYHIHHTNRYLHSVTIQSASDAVIAPSAQAKIQYYPFIFDGTGWVRA